MAIVDGRHTCDFCGEDIPKDKERKCVGIPIPVCMTHERDDGLGAKFQEVVTRKIDVCERHFDMVVPIYSLGREGFKEMYLFDDDDDCEYSADAFGK